MRTTTDFTPFHRSSVGFDRVFDLLDNARGVQQAESWPPYDIERIGEDRYRVTLAAAGYAADELDVTAQPNELVISGDKSEDEANVEVLHRGLPHGAFEKRFKLADYLVVTGASLANGLLTVELVRELPEAMKPRQIPLETESAEPGRRAAPKSLTSERQTTA